MNNSGSIKDVMTIDEAATYKNVSRQAIEYQCKKYWGPSGLARKAGLIRGTWIISKAAVDAYIPDEAKKND